jgi:hypothetical protein
VVKVEINFLYQRRIGVGRSVEGSLRRWYRFNAFILASRGEVT